MTRTQKAAELIAAIHKLFQDAPDSITINIHKVFNATRLEMTLHGFRSHEDGTTFLRELGIGKREKQVIETDEKYWHALSGEADGVKFSVYCAGLPASCKLVTEMKKVPKQETVDTGEFIEVPFKRVVCGSHD